MATTYVTLINSLDCYPTQPQPNCVFQINWYLRGYDTDTGMAASVLLSTNVPYVATDSFIPYDQLTTDVVQGWINEYTDPSVIMEAKTTIDAAIASQQNPSTVSPPLPWNVPAPQP